MYADDTVIYNITNLCSSERSMVVQADLYRVVQLNKRRRLILNQSKTKSLLFGSGQNLRQITKFLYTVIRKDFRKSSQI